MKIRRLVLIPLLAIGLAACQTPGGKTAGGTLLGAAAGGLLGAQFGSGTGKVAAAAAGTFLGALVGNQVGESLDRADRLYATRAQQQAAAAPVGQTIQWSNPDSGNYGTVTPVRDGRDRQNGTFCREYQTTVTVGGRTESAFGTACLQPDGSWQLVG